MSVHVLGPYPTGRNLDLSPLKTGPGTQFRSKVAKSIELSSFLIPKDSMQSVSTPLWHFVKIALKSKASISELVHSLVSSEAHKYISLGICPRNPLTIAYRELGLEYPMELSEL